MLSKLLSFLPFLSTAWAHTSSHTSPSSTQTGYGQSPTTYNDTDPYTQSPTTYNSPSTNCQLGPELPKAECWDDLALGTEFVPNWWAENQGTCQLDYNGSFANCFMSLAPKGPYICNTNTVGASCPFPLWSDYQHIANGTAKFYTAWAIANTLSLLLDIQQGVTQAASPVSDLVGELITTLTPPKEASTSVGEYILDALSFGLSLYAEGGLIMKALLRSLPQTSTLADKFFPSGDTIPFDINAWADVQAQLGKVIETWTQNVGEAIPSVQDSVTIWTSFASGAGAAGSITSLTGIETSIANALGAYLASAAITETRFLMTRSASLSIAQLQQSGTPLNWNVDCASGYDSNGFCGEYFFDGNDTYGLVNTQNLKTEATGQQSIMQTLLTNITTGQLLFTGAYQCSQTCGHNGGCNATFNGGSEQNPDCISNGAVCSWTWDAKGPFEDEDGCGGGTTGPLGYWGNDAGKCGAVDAWDVPSAYTGGGIIAGDKAPGFWKDQHVCNSADSPLR